jgi:hypothetical protein
MTRTAIVRYQTHPEAAEENARLVADVYAALAEIDPGGFQYETHRLADGVTFVHVVHQDTPDNPLTTLPAFATFQRDLAQRCVVPPAASETTIVGSYGT